MVDSGLQAALLVVGVFLLVVVCALFQRRPRPEAYSPEELSQIRIDRELAKEVKNTERELDDGGSFRLLVVYCLCEKVGTSKYSNLPSEIEPAPCNCTCSHPICSNLPVHTTCFRVALFLADATATGDSGRESTAVERARSGPQAQSDGPYSSQGYWPLAAGYTGAMGCEG